MITLIFHKATKCQEQGHSFSNISAKLNNQHYLIQPNSYLTDLLCSIIHSLQVRQFCEHFFFNKSFWRTFGEQLFLLKVSGELSANNFFMKSFWRTFGKQFFNEKFLANFRRTTSYFGDFNAKSPKVRHRVAISGDFWQTLDTVFRRTKRFAASLPQTSPFAKG